MRQILIILSIIFSFTVNSCSVKEENSTTETTVPTVLSNYPADSASSVAPNTSLTVTLSKAMDTTTITTNTDNTTCYGSLQVSSDSFSTCVQMDTSPSATDSNKTFTLDPDSNLSYNTTYKVKVTTDVKDSAGNALASAYTHSTGFITSSTLDTTVPTVSSSSPADSATSIAANTSLTVTFSESMNTPTITTNSSGTGCLGTLQLSSDSFSTCVQMDTSPSATDSYKTFTLDPASKLSYNTTYKVKVTTDAKDSAGNALASAYTHSTGFSTPSTQQLGTSSSDTARGVATDSSGNVYVTGYTEGGLDGNTSAGRADIFVLKYNSSGTKQWTKQLGTTGNDFAYGVATDASGNIYVTGITSGGLDGNSSAGNTDIFVLKYDSSGTKQWTKQLGTLGNDFAFGVATDSSANVYVTGYTTGGMDNNTSAGSYDTFLLKYNSSGTKQWTKQLGTSGNDFAYGVATDSSANVYVTGYTEGGMDSNTSAGSFDIFVVKYDSSGTKQWTKQLGTAANDFAYGVVTDSSANVYVTGNTGGGLDGNSSAGSADIFVVKYNSSGTKQWTKQLGTASVDAANGVSTDSSGNAYVTGNTTGGLDGNTNAGSTDIFVVKYNSSGTKQWTKQIGTLGNDFAYGVATDSSANVYLTGYTTGGLDGNTSAGSYDLFVLKYNSSGTKL